MMLNSSLLLAACCLLLVATQHANAQDRGKPVRSFARRFVITPAPPTYASLLRNTQPRRRPSDACPHVNSSAPANGAELTPFWAATVVGVFVRSRLQLSLPVATCCCGCLITPSCCRTPVVVVSLCACELRSACGRYE